MRDTNEVWEQLKKQLSSDPRFIIGTYIDKRAIEVFIKEGDYDKFKDYIQEMMKDIAIVTERWRRTLVVEMKKYEEE
jgi:pentatricopeptide repeat protein